ncbi:FGGY-family carbohydrate kinase [Conexibacter sp. CPCC 206217]|uniref:xylulokinase n=1 Tax=Conexibacter sp. CPCC 206217 TaxID=3064574 RepID=UPI00272346E9|nr:FGGY-family carbohydrate kinase [Conexibacter sp. CPCC 206217]MDO8211024.1 FGGY-family carbohydrate kinase [Conexibacter sp. CPCC 206217]
MTAAAAEPVVLAIDVGSSRVRATLISLRDGTSLASAARPTGAAGGELDAAGLWADVVAAVRELPRGDVEVRGAGVASLLSLVLVDDDGEPVRDALLWSDTRARAEAVRIGERVGAGGRIAAGRRVTAELPAAKLAWIGHHEPAALRRARWALSLKDFLVLHLTGRALTDLTHASYSGLFDVSARRWEPSLIAAAELDAALLPPVTGAWRAAGPLTAGAASELRLAPGIPIAAGGPDGTVGALGAGAVRAGTTVDVAGTTDVLLHVLSAPAPDPTGTAVLNAHAAPDLWTLGGPTGSTGGAVEWAARLLGHGSAAAAHAALDEQAEALPPGAGGVVFRPSLDGSRFPGWRPEERGAIDGLCADHGPAHLFRAVQEGVAFTVAEGVDALRRRGAHVEEIVVVGGAAARPATLQLRADACGADVLACSDREATTRGAAILAAVACGADPHPASAAARFVAPGRRYRPDERAAERLAGARARWRALLAADAAPS